MKTKYHLSILLIALLSGLMGFATDVRSKSYSISVENETLKVTQKATASTTSKFTFTPSELDVDAGYHYQVVNLSCDKKFAVTGLDNLDWAIVVGYEAVMKQSNVLKIVVNENSGAERTGYLTIKTTAGDATLKVTQKSGKLILTPSELNMDENRHKYNVTLRCGREFRVFGYDAMSWVRVKYKGDTNQRYTFNIIVGENIGPKRTGYITIKTSVGNMTLKVTQKAHTPGQLTLTPSEVTMDAIPRECKVTLSCNKKFIINGCDKLGWVMVSSYKAGKNQSNILNIEFRWNPGAERTGYITIKTTEGNVTLKVTQKGTMPAQFTFTPSELDVDANRNNYSVILRCDKSFSITDLDKPDWLTLNGNPPGYGKSRTFTIAVQANPGTERTGYITLKTTEGEKKFKVTQKAAASTQPAPSIKLSKNEITLEATTATERFTLTSNCAWERKFEPKEAASYYSGWIELTPPESSVSTGKTTNTEFVMMFAPNRGTTERTAKIIFTSTKDPSVTATLTVKQKGKVAAEPEPKPKPTVQVSSVTLDLPKATINGDRESFRLEATVLPANATNPALLWSSSDPSVASVEAASTASLLKAGVIGRAVTVRIHKKGKAEITARAMDGSGKMASFQVEVLSTVGNIEAAAARIYTAGSTLHLSLPQAAVVRICNVAGHLVHMLNAPAGDTSVTLPSGVYIVKAGTAVEKVRID